MSQDSSPTDQLPLRPSRRAFLIATLRTSSLLVLAACAPAAQAPTSTPAPAAKPPAAASPGAPVASPAASPGAAASPAASPAAQAPATAAGFPSKPIEIIVPSGVGGGLDAVARQLAPPMQEMLGQPVVVKNVAGGGQRIGARQFEQSPPDGHIIFYGADATIYVSTLVEPAEGFDMSKWIWAAGIRKVPALVMVSKDSPYQTIQEVIAADKSGTRLRFPHNGIGGFLTTNIVVVSSLGLTNAAQVGGFTGTGDMIPSVVRGDTDVLVSYPISSAIQFIQSGDLRPLVVLTPERSSLIPQTPTAREAGLPNVAELEGLTTSTYGFAVRPGAPEDRVRVLEQTTIKAVADPGFLAWAKTGGVDLDLTPLSTKDFTDLKRNEYALWGKYEKALRVAAAS